ncbi:FecR family protein [Eilatimonas milleporae]|uniref:FecR family protein n=1 Tax=Eilatimonas milleporae TaxID=911205 RepID=A0A3M0CRM7_9PROT|nr:FecR domain-containing protein [Eilatimonas milleporae]RMB12214.1 FecR family protein [Eilatimonas milleporae]
MPRHLTPELKRISYEAHEWLARLEEPPLSSQIRADFNAWLTRDPRHRQEYEKAQTSVALTQTLHKSDFPDTIRPSRYGTFRSHVMDVVDFVWDRKGLSLAAGGALAAGLAFVVFFGPRQTITDPLSAAPVVAQYESNLGERTTVALADGTEVTLGARSSVETRFYAYKRTVTLTAGVAYFDVAPDAARPFTVKAGDLTATAVGTAFDVRNSGDTFRVGVAEGRVEVGYPFIMNGQYMGMTTTRDLAAGQEVTATIADGLQNVADTGTHFIAAWRTDRLVYQNVSIAELVVDLNRYAQTPIAVDGDAPEIKTLQFSGVFPDVNIDAVLDTLSDIHPIRIDRTDPGQTVLRKK